MCGSIAPGSTPCSARCSAAVQLHLPRAAARSARTLTEHEGKRALADFGVPVPRSRLVAAAEASAAAATLGFPVVIKAIGSQLEHKSELGGVALDVRSAAEAEATAQRLSALSATLLVEEMVSDGVAEVLVGVSVDPQFGQL